MANEEWRNFSDINGRSFSKYEVSSLGQIRDRNSGYILSDKPTSSGYVRYTVLDDEGKRRSVSAHSIVARTFLGEPESDDLTPDHINRDSTDNRLVNLRWATKKQQIDNSDKSKRGPRGQSVIQYTMDMEEIKRWTNITTAAKELGIYKNGINNACSRKYKSAGGFK